MNRNSLFSISASHFWISAFCALALFSCQQEAPSNSNQITIHAGSPNGSYSALVNLLDDRVESLRTANCESMVSGCPAITQFHFDTACDNGGSKENLQRLGMQLLETVSQPTGFRPCEKDGAPREIDDNDFAIVQNYFIASAAQTYCNTEDCEAFFAAQMDGERYAKFEDLRIVLPLYNGLIQFVGAQRTPALGEAANRIALEELQGGVVYLRGVNSKYGNEVLNRHPGLLNRFPTTLGPENFGPSFEPLRDQIGDRTALRNLSIPQWNAVWEFINAYESEPDRGNRLLACGLIDAYVISGTIIEDGREFTLASTPEIAANLPENCTASYQQQQIQIPEVIIDALTRDHPYYQKLPPPETWSNTPITSVPGVTTYLVTTANANTALVESVTAALFDDWNNLMLLEDELSPIPDNVLKKPAPYHPGAEAALNERGLLSAGFSLDFILEIFLILGLLSVLNRIWRSREGYNRLGERQGFGINHMFWHSLTDIILIIFWWMFGLMVVVTTIRFFDSQVATTQNINDQLSGLGFGGTLVWIFTFISSGYEDNVFPSSNPARVIVSIFAIAGVAYPLYLIAKTWDQVRTQRNIRARGGEYRGLFRFIADSIAELTPWSYRSKGTLLLCGWNSRAPGLIYTITCPDSPFEGVINILADPEIEYPISTYGFNKKRVRFYRGDSSHRNHLERAEAMRADTALILTDESAGRTNSSGVLTALAIERMKPEIVVCAEMTMSSGSRDFTEQHIDSVFDPGLISRQMLTLGCFDNYVLDFALDALSPDEHYEWYAKKTRTLLQLLPGADQPNTLAELSASLQRIGILVIGACAANDEVTERGVLAKDFKKDTYLDPLLAIDSMQRPLNPDEYIVCAAENPASFKPRTFGSNHSLLNTLAPIAEDDTFIIQNSKSSAAVLIIGHEEQAAAIAGHISETIGISSRVVRGEVETETIATDVLYGEQLNVKISQSLASNEWTHVLLLSSIPGDHQPGQFEKLAAAADSDTIMRANFIRVELNKLNKNPIIVAEANRTHNRQLAKDANVTTVVPSSLLIERLLARMVSGGGRVPEMLSAMLSQKDDTLLKSIKLHAGHPLIGGAYDRVFNTWFADGRVLGILPKGSALKAQSLRNTSDDFDWHFVMSPPLTDKQPLLIEKDVIVVLANGNVAIESK